MMNRNLSILSFDLQAADIPRNWNGLQVRIRPKHLMRDKSKIYLGKTNV